MPSGSFSTSVSFCLYVSWSASMCVSLSLCVCLSLSLSLSMIRVILWFCLSGVASGTAGTEMWGTGIETGQTGVSYYCFVGQNQVCMVGCARCGARTLPTPKCSFSASLNGGNVNSEPIKVLTLCHPKYLQINIHAALIPVHPAYISIRVMLDGDIQDADQARSFTSSNPLELNRRY